MELVTADAAVVSAVAGVHEAWRVRQAGEIRRRPVSWDVRLGLEEDPWDGRWKGFVALHRDAAGDVDGYVRYRAQPKWEDREARGVLAVDDLLALNDAAYAALWRFLAEVDLVATVKAEGRPVSERLPWLLTNARAARLTDVGDALWVRVFDVARALEARSWERSGSLVLEVIDDSVAGGRSRVVLDASPEGATCRPTDLSPDLSLPVAAIGAAYLGGTRLRDAAVATGFDEHRAGALAAADGMFKSGEEPWCSTHF
jgi:predicted acetyltransferase